MELAQNNPKLIGSFSCLICVYVHMCMSKLGVSFLMTLYFDISLLWDLRLTSLARQSGCCTLEILSSWPPQHWGAKHMLLHLGFYVSARGLNSGPCAYTASTLWTELTLSCSPTPWNTFPVSGCL